MHLRVIIGLLLTATFLAGNAAMGGEPVTASDSDGVLTVENGLLAIQCGTAELRFTSLTGDTMFLSSELSGEARVVDIEGSLGQGKAVEVSAADGNMTTFALYPGIPFVCVTTTLTNGADAERVVDAITSFAGSLDLGVTMGELSVLGCDGLTGVDAVRASYSFLAAGHPETRTGMVAGWLTHERGSGIVFSRPEEGHLRLEARCEYGKLRIAPGESARSETFAVGYFNDALDGLEAYADAAGKCNDVRLPERIPSGYCTWYSSPHGGASDEKSMAKLAQFCKEHLTPFGFDTLQIDDKWQISGRDFTTHRPGGPYRSGMKPTADTIKTAGMQAGIWYIPFGWDHKRPIFEQHQDWFVKRESGDPYEVHWAGTCLDMTHPDARTFLREVVARMSREWGYDYMKIDGLWTGLAAGILYPEPTYRDDGLGDAVFHDTAKTNLEAYRDGLDLVREAAGEDVFILGCNIAQNMRTLGASFGKVDGMRVGRDIGANWDHIIPCAELGTRLYFFHGRVWYNDPDCLMLREPLTLDQARAWGSWIAITGQLNLVSEWLPGLPEERLDIVKRTMPNHGLCARPVDLFRNPIAQVWHLADGRQDARRDVIGVFNWDAEQSVTVSLDMDALGIATCEDGSHVGFDYWANTFVVPFEGRLEVELPPASCKVLSIQPRLSRPQLVSTSRHVTQGIVDVSGVAWDEAAGVLLGMSKVVAGDPYELRLFTNGRSLDGVTISQEGTQEEVRIRMGETEGDTVRVTFTSETSRGVNWRLQFTER